MRQQPDTARTPRGAGVLVQTEVERIDLGVHAGHQLQAHVEHRTLRLALGKWWSGSLTLGHRRPTHVEVDHAPDTPGATERAAQTPYDVAIARPADPWPQYARRMLVVTGGCWMAVTLARRLWRDEGGNR